MYFSVAIDDHDVACCCWLQLFGGMARRIENGGKLSIQPYIKFLRTFPPSPAIFRKDIAQFENLPLFPSARPCSLLFLTHVLAAPQKIQLSKSSACLQRSQQQHLPPIHFEGIIIADPIRLASPSLPNPPCPPISNARSLIYNITPPSIII